MDILKFKIGKYYLGSNGTYIKILGRYTDKENREHVEIQDFDARNCPTGWTTHFCVAINYDKERCIETVCGHVTPNRKDEIWRAENECEKIKLLPAIHRPAKFKVGHMYKDADKDGVFMVTAKYKSPHDNKTYLIAQRLSLHQIGQIICIISKDENEDEFINRYTVDYRPVKCSARDEVEKIEKEIPLY